MQKLYRNIFAAGVISLGLAACGDDVTVTPPPAPPTPGVSSVTVSPASSTISVGQTVVFAAAVVADVGITNTTVAWSSNNTAIATVDASTGAVLGKAPGTTTIVAKSNADNSRVGVATVTVVSLPPGVTSFNATPNTITLLVGGTQTGVVTAVYAAGVTAPAISWSTLNGTVASVGTSTGVITALSPGTAIIRATATLPADATRGTSAQTVTADITVSVAPAPSISINSITQGAITVPVNVANVMGQIEINLNFNPRDQPMDSVVVYIDQAGVPKTAAKQIFNGAIPAAGILTLSVNTANFTKNFTPGTTTVTFLNGQTTARAAVWRTNPNGTSSSIGGPIAANCSVAPGSPICAAPIALVLNNADGWAADWGPTGNGAKPTTTAQRISNGLTYWGGPSAGGILTATLYSVIYTPGRDIAQVNWSVGTASTGNLCANSAELLPGTPAISTTRPWRRTFGYVAAGAGISCSFREWTGFGLGDRDNVVVGVAIDNNSNPFIGALVPNTVVFNSTPDSLRMDHLGPAVGTPSITRSAPAVTGWINAGFNFVNFASTDLGVGLRATRDRTVVYNVINCPTLGAQGVAMPSGTGADIPECGALVNIFGGTPGLGFPGIAPYNAQGKETDLLSNAGISSVTSTFGVDKTVPLIRAGLASVSPITLPAMITASQVFSAAKPSVVVGSESEFRAEYNDDRSGFYNFGSPDGFGVAAQQHALSRAGHFNNAGICLIGTPPIGAAFVTAPTCGLAFITSTAGTTGGGTAPRSDGWFAGQRVGVPQLESYYGYLTQVTDEAGNVSAQLFRNALVNAVSPFVTGLGIPATLTNANFGIQGTYADSAEITQQSLQLEYPNLPTVDSARYSRNPIGVAFNDVISSPLAVTNDPRGCLPPQPTGACTALNPYVRRIETTNATAFPASNVMPATTPVNVKPTTARAWSWNHGSTLFTAPTPGTAAPAPAASLLVAIPALNVQDGLDQAAYNAANPNSALTHFRIISTISTTDQFGSTVPLRAQAVSPTNSPNAPFVRVDFYRLQNNTIGTNPNAPFTGAAGQVAGFWSYLGSAFGNVDACPTGTSATSGAVCHTDQGTYKSWVYALSAANYVVDWSGQIQTTLVGSPSVVTGVLSGHRVIAVGVTANGDGIVTQLTIMLP